MFKPFVLATMVAAVVGLAAPVGARAADAITVVCFDNPTHPDCGKTEFFPVSEEAEGNEAFRKLRARLFDPADPVALMLNYSKWGNTDGSQESDFEAAFIYPIDKARCLYGEAERVFYFDEGGPVEGGSNEVTARATIYYLNNIDPRSIAVRGHSVFAGGERLFLGTSDIDADRLAKGWAQIYAQNCKGK